MKKAHYVVAGDMSGGQIWLVLSETVEEAKTEVRRRDGGDLKNIFAKELTLQDLCGILEQEFWGAAELFGVASKEMLK